MGFMFVNNVLLGIALYFLCFGILSYTLVFADVEKNKFAYFLKVTLPELLVKIELRILGERGMKKAQAVHGYIFYERNPLLQVMYCAIVFGGWSVMFAYGYPLMPNKYVSGMHKVNGYFLFIACITSAVATVRKSPGCITAHNIALYDTYEYDGIMFGDKICPTIGIRKLARSKYDRMTKSHVPRFDHYCAWVNNTIGEENYRLFYIFLIVHMFMLWYGAYVTGMIFLSEIDNLNLHTATFYDGNGRKIEATSTIAYQYLIQKHTPLACLWILKFVLALVLTGFVAFHTYLICTGMTTNEYYKWKTAKDLWKRQLKQEKVEKIGSNDNSMHDEDRDGILIDFPDDVDIGCTGVQNIINDAKQKSTKSSNAPLISTLCPKELPSKYPYNFGIIVNFRDVFSPRCFRKDAQQRHLKHIQDKKEE